LNKKSHPLAASIFSNQAMKTYRSFLHTSPSIALYLAVGVGGAWAQSPAGENTAKIGLGLVLNDEGYKGVGLKTRLVPALQIQTPRFSLRGTSAEYVLTDPANANYSLNLRADLLLQGYKSSDAVLFSGMVQRKPSLLVGVGSKFSTPVGQLWLEAGVDALGNSKGLRTEAGLGWRMNTNSALGKWSLSPYLSVQHNNAKLTNYYYGVTTSEAIVGRAAYEAGASTNFNLGISASTDISSNFSLVLGARYRGYGASIRQSPLIDSAGGLSGTASVLYRLY
jgi:outer membrane scaffolding protein for murein synthesis (MipA/OmpV family)